MNYELGMWVQNPNQPDWGVGKVVGIGTQKIKVIFSQTGEKNLMMHLVTLQEVSSPAAGIYARTILRAVDNPDFSELDRLCHAFYSRFRDRRPNVDDGGMAIRVMEEMHARGDLTRSTARRLFQWCHTGGSYVDGIDLAQQICRLVYGRVPTPAEVEAAGF